MNSSTQFWEDAYKRNANKLLGVCRRYVSGNTVAQDLVQETFIKAIEKWNTYSGRGNFDAWLRVIAVNVALMYLRQEKSKLSAIQSAVDYDLETDEGAEEIDDSMRASIERASFSDEDLIKVINELPNHHKMVFNMYVMDNYSHAEISKELNISVGTSKSHLARARKKLQQLLYNKLQTTEENKKRKRFIILFLWPFEVNYIDRLFKNQLKRYNPEIGLDYRQTSLQTRLSERNIPHPKSTYLPIAVKISLAVIMVTSCFWLHISYAERENLSNQEYKSSAYNPDSTTGVHHEPKPILKDTMFIDTLDTLTPPVVVRKKIVKRQVVAILADTLNNTDSLNAQ